LPAKLESPVSVISLVRAARNLGVFLFVVFLAYVQYSPLIDLDYVTINGRDYYVGAWKRQQTRSVAAPIDGQRATVRNLISIAAHRATAAMTESFLKNPPVEDERRETFVEAVIPLLC